LKDRIQVQLGQKRSKQEESGRGGKDFLILQIPDQDGFGLFGDIGAFHGHFHLESGSSGEFGKAFLSKDSFHSTNRELDALFGETFDDIPGGERMGTVGLDVFSGRGVDPMSVGKAFGDGFGEVQFFRGKEVTK
jgi:hypothetical protein